jgi:hypothetical protein
MILDDRCWHLIRVNGKSIAVVGFGANFSVIALMPASPRKAGDSPGKKMRLKFYFCCHNAVFAIWTRWFVLRLSRCSQQAFDTAQADREVLGVEA